MYHLSKDPSTAWCRTIGSPSAGANPSGGLAVTPVLHLRALPESTAANLSLFLGFEIAWWSGLPKHPLDLPDSEACKKESSPPVDGRGPPGF